MAFAEIIEVGRVLKAHLILASQKRLRGAAPRTRANRHEDFGISSQVASSHFCDLVQVLSEPRFSHLCNKDITYLLGFLWGQVGQSMPSAWQKLVGVQLMLVLLSSPLFYFPHGT